MIEITTISCIYFASIVSCHLALTRDSFHPSLWHFIRSMELVFSLLSTPSPSTIFHFNFNSSFPVLFVCLCVRPSHYWYRLSKNSGVSSFHSFREGSPPLERPYHVHTSAAFSKICKTAFLSGFTGFSHDCLYCGSI